MLKTIPPHLEKQLVEMGFESDEIVIFDTIHQFKEEPLFAEIKKIIRAYSFKRMMEEATKTWKEKQWDEQTVFEIVEDHRKRKKVL